MSGTYRYKKIRPVSIVEFEVNTTGVVSTCTVDSKNYSCGKLVFPCSDGSVHQLTARESHTVGNLFFANGDARKGHLLSRLTEK